MRQPTTRGEWIFLNLVVLVLILGSLNIAKAQGWLIPPQEPIPVDNGVIDIATLTLEQKIAQMVIVHGGPWNEGQWKALQVGGIHLFAKERQELFEETIKSFQKNMTIPFFVTADLEGCLNPFAAFQEFPAAADITTTTEAFEKGLTEGQYLRSLGFSINYAPVVDLDDQIWTCRSFPGNETIVAELARAYVEGLQQEGVIATAKHYPGKTLVVRDPHKYIVAATIQEEDIYPYTVIAGSVKAVMVSHIITSGTIDSQGIPAVTSPEVIGSLKQSFTGLVISDEINMLGLRDFYPSLDEMYIAVFKAGNDIVLNFNEDPNEVYRMIEVVAEAVEEGDIPEEQIDAAVRKILEAKGFVVR